MDFFSVEQLKEWLLNSSEHKEERSGLFKTRSATRRYRIGRNLY
jgi:hypothetical protein